MAGVVFQLNVSRGGIPKRPIDEGRATALGLQGDSHAHPQIHGGPQQALLLITHEGIDELAALGFAVTPGALGENITTRGLDRRKWRAGQRYRIGNDVVIELTKRRAPCQTLLPFGPGIHKALYDRRVEAHDPTSPRWGLSGFYAAVVEPGMIRFGDEILPA